MAPDVYERMCVKACRIYNIYVFLPNPGQDGPEGASAKIWDPLSHIKPTKLTEVGVVEYLQCPKH
jgi:hypothetical protein